MYEYMYSSRGLLYLAGSLSFQIEVLVGGNPCPKGGGDDG